MSDATTIRQYIEQWCGWAAKTSVDNGETDDDIRQYFTRENFASMFGSAETDPDDRWDFDELASEAISMADEIRNPSPENDSD